MKFVVFVLNQERNVNCRTQPKKLDLIAWINRLSDEDIIEFLDGLKKSKSKNDWWDELSENQQKIVQNGIDDIENGNDDFISEVLEEIER